jgi:uncharacterized protein (DUF488 family)
MTYPFFTIGHSARFVGEFVELVRQAEIRLIVDVRTIPRSRTNPQYDSKEFATVLAEFQIGYEHNAALGGLRGRQHNVPADVNAFWENQSFHNYADYAMSEGLPRRPNQVARCGACQAVRHHVCRGGVVAMSSADHR